MNRFHLIVLLVAVTTASALAAGPALEAPTVDNPRRSATTKVVSEQPRQITWEELVPKDWNPMKDFKDIDLGALEDGDPRANELFTKMRQAADNAPTNPALNGVSVKLPGYIVPLDREKNGKLIDFLLVPYFGACIHTPPPPANQILHVRPKAPVDFHAMDTVWVVGKLRSVRNSSVMGVSGYSMNADDVSIFKGDAK